MSLSQELLSIRHALMRLSFMLVILFVLFFAVPFSPFTLGTYSFPALSGETVAQWSIGEIARDMLPSGTSLISLSPLDPFMAESAVAGVLAFLVLLPMLSYEVWRFVSPGLHKHERKGLVWFFIAGMGLISLGIVFSYVVLVPAILTGLHALNPASVVAMYGLRAVVSLVTSLTLATALLFLLPAVMVILSKVGVVPVSFWRTYARHALFISIIFSAIITPDGSGLSAVLLTVPLCVLYGAGYVASALLVRGSPVFITNTH